MEQNTDRMGFALIALSVVAFVLLAVNGPLKSTVDGFFNGFKDWQTATVNGISESNKQDVTHTAYSWSANGTDRFTTTKPNLNLLAGTSQNLSVQGLNQQNQHSSGTNQMYYFANGQNLFQQNIGTNTKVTISFDWIATPTTGTLDSLPSSWSSFKMQYNDVPWINDGINKTQVNVTPTNSSGHVEVTSPSADVDNMSSAIATGIEMRLDNIPKNINITISNLKYEISQPKYIGTYTDKNETASQEPSDYTWKLNPEYHE